MVWTPRSQKRDLGHPRLWWFDVLATRLGHEDVGEDVEGVLAAGLCCQI